jgi:hypothetical protein
VVATVLVVTPKGAPLVARVDMVVVKLLLAVGASPVTLSKVGDDLSVPDGPSPEGLSFTGYQQGGYQQGAYPQGGFQQGGYQQGSGYGY